jgi:hypothetical protein
MPTILSRPVVQRRGHLDVVLIGDAGSIPAGPIFSRAYHVSCWGGLLSASALSGSRLRKDVSWLSSSSRGRQWASLTAAPRSRHFPCCTHTPWMNRKISGWSRFRKIESRCHTAEMAFYGA